MSRLPGCSRGEDTVGVDPEMVREYFLQDCDESTIEQALARLSRHSLAPFGPRPDDFARLLADEMTAAATATEQS